MPYLIRFMNDARVGLWVASLRRATYRLLPRNEMSLRPGRLLSDKWPRTKKIRKTRDSMMSKSDSSGSQKRVPLFIGRSYAL